MREARGDVRVRAVSRCGGSVPGSRGVYKWRRSRTQGLSSKRVSVSCVFMVLCFMKLRREEVHILGGLRQGGSGEKSQQVQEWLLKFAAELKGLASTLHWQDSSACAQEYPSRGFKKQCVKVAIKEKQVKYFIHYSGWNKNWDEWVPESRVLKYVDTNLQKQKELQKANQDHYVEGKMRAAAPGKKTAALQQKNVEVKTKKNKQKGPGSGEGSSTSEIPQPPRKKRARIDPTVESEETFMNRVEVKVKIPEELKPWLVDDWDLITRQKQLFNLPAKKNVETVLEEYATYKKSRGNTDNKEYAVNEVVAGIKEYFNVMLGTQLLYKFERPQYADILADHPDTPMSQVYGAPHLLRLFVRIGAMLSYTPLDEKSLALLLNYLHDFLKYLSKNFATLFSASDYEVAPPEYHRKAV
ncbi:mortality factor 4-like protein 1 isoform X2 [Xenopus laevis]|uniref:Mortality factor 4-like protein 1 isoform X2 n=1 Tax=Xenopus laevis TaxID=8355 RepID=A0A8J0USV9_XENLA|nr:mortality factor 4-like protein 1 isoform X2 [Xenopus laevis]